MAEHSQVIESSAFPDEDEETITMLDVIEREDKLEEEASAVLGNSDEKNCTYPKGYIPRQALYSCATCSKNSGHEAAICLACSLECHDNHDVYELYTKRNYRCDCGNSKFKPEFQCKLLERNQKKAPLNENNVYNHNFSGRYCTCDQQYPPDENDDSAESHDEMWQCILCEDWFHTKHLEARELPTKFEELACGPCVEKLEFLRYYQLIDKLETSNKEPSCILDKLKVISETSKVEDGPIFWPDISWRSQLCRCERCMSLYESKNCLYLTDEKDTVHHYEAQGKALAKNNQTPMERGMSALNGMNRAAVCEALHGYDELKADLSVYLRKFADNNKVVREQDIHEFFEQLKSKKRKLE